MSDLMWRLLSNRMTGEIQAQLRSAQSDIVRQTAMEILTEVRRSMNEPKHGRIYIYGGYVHQASAPGEAPATDTGGLWASYQVYIEETSDGTIGIVGSDNPNAANLEYGTSKIAPRPALVPAVEQSRTKFTNRTLSRLRKIGS